MLPLSDVAYGLGIAATTVVVVVVAAMVIALALLFRRRQGARPSAASGLSALTTRAGVLLVRADEALTAADNELGYALAQFGDTRTTEFADAVAQARAQLQEAFRLRHQLDDATPESDQKAREWTLQIVALCEGLLKQLDRHDRTFTTRRDEEAGASQRLDALRQAINTQLSRLELNENSRVALAARYDDALLSGLAGVAADARRLLDEANEYAQKVESGLSPAGVNAVADQLRDAEERVQQATLALNAVGVRESELDAASDALNGLVSAAKKDLTSAKKLRDAAPDPETGGSILAAIEGVTAALGAVTAIPRGHADPHRGLASLGAAIESLDSALAGARNQTERLEHARTALAGSLISARSQISEVRNYISGGSVGVGADARTRLAEAERQLMLAEAEADPVEALDAARRAVTHARDADALARYSAMGRR